MNIGIFGGCFNPPHKMHKNIALNLIEKGYLDKIIYVPTGDNYSKLDLIDFKHRLKMLELITDNKKLLVSDIGNNPMYEYTYQTLDYFKKIYKDDQIYFICGPDNLNEFDTWKNYKYILDNYKLLVIKRNNDNLNLLLNKYKENKNSIIFTDIDSVLLSSTLIRKKLNKRKEVLKYIDNNVYQYIKENNLYNEVEVLKLK